MTRILGIDPGSRVTGYGLIETEPNGTSSYVASGCIRTQERDFVRRLKIIFDGVDSLISDYSPEECAVEDVFVSKNPMSALKLGQARSAAIVAAQAHDLPISEYGASKIKNVLVGTGAAQKRQVMYMIKLILKIDGDIATDASDALAVALCHAQLRSGFSA